mmetsp:Transcript_29743/g.79936  ORF Transcript_29743/g.79936 Transcript_29743/m.79936 type:complete len:221 (-) Transcript_29743:74-736(-)
MSRLGHHDAANHLVDNLQEGGAGGNGGGHSGHEAKHGEAAVSHLGIRGETTLRHHVLGGQGDDDTVRLLVLLALLHVEGETVLEAKGRNGGRERDEESVHVRDEDDGAAVGDAGGGAGHVAIHGERAPHGGVEGLVRVGDQTVRRGVASGDNREPAEHGVAAVPALSLSGGAKAALGELREVRLEGLHGGLEDGCLDVRAGNRLAAEHRRARTGGCVRGG